MEWSRIAQASAAVGLAVAAALALTSLVPVIAPAPGVVDAIIFVGIFPTFGTAVIAAARRQRQNEPQPTRRRSRRLQFPVPWWLPFLGVVALVCFFSAIASLPGQPEHQGSVYFFNDHGSHIPTTHAGYLRGLRAQQRIFSAIPAVFYSVALAGWNWLNGKPLWRTTPGGG